MSGLGDSGSTDRTRKKSAVTQELFGVRAIVHPDGLDAKISLHTTDGRIELSVPIGQIAAAHAEIRSAAILMLHRQSMKKDQGTAMFDELLLTALKPTRCTPIIDRKTGDRVFVLQFPDRLPIVIQMSPELVAESLTDLSAISMKAAN